MDESTLRSQVDAANAYETLFVPALFQQWPPIIADAAHIQPGQRVLDVACGTGVLAREIASRVRPGGQVTAIDRNLGMIAVAQQVAPGIDWHEGAAEFLPFPQDSFDAVVSQFGLMFFTDRARALHEMLRVLTRGGSLAVAVWDAVETMPAYARVVALLDQTVGQAAADALRAPFVLGNRQKLGALFVEAGIREAKITTHRGIARFPSIHVMVEADLRGWLPLVGIVLTEDQITRVLHEAEVALAPYAAPDGRVAFELSIHLVTAKK